MLGLNNRYALDGRDPNSASGVVWCLGRYGRPWGPERPMFGAVRFMSSENTARKVRVTRYIARHAPLRSAGEEDAEPAARRYPCRTGVDGGTMSSDRLQRQICFILEIDALKDVLRQSYLLGAKRRENAAEHSWHVAVMAVLLAEHANEPVDPSRVARMMLFHDIVEVDAGDTYVYDESAAAARKEKERSAADRLFGLLPSDQAGELRALWEEFESGQTADARFAAALDRLMPVLHNVHTAGRSWREHGITVDRVISRNSRIREGSEGLWKFARSLIEDAVAAGYLAPTPHPRADDPFLHD